MQDFLPHTDLSFSVFSFLLHLSLLAVTPSPLHHLHPAGGFSGSPVVSLSCPLGNVGSSQVCAFQRCKGAERCSRQQQVTKNFPKPRAKPSPFLYQELPSLPSPWHTEPDSARSEWLSKSKWEEAQLISVRSLKSPVKGGERGK